MGEREDLAIPHDLQFPVGERCQQLPREDDATNRNPNLDLPTKIGKIQSLETWTVS